MIWARVMAVNIREVDISEVIILNIGSKNGRILVSFQHLIGPLIAKLFMIYQEYYGSIRNWYI